MFRVVAVALVSVFSAGIQVACQPIKAFSYPDTETARKFWEPQFGSKPVRVETLEDGSTCLALDADFARPQDRACWDWSTKLDLTKVGRISFEIASENGGISGSMGIFFGTPNGWYANFWWWGAADNWTPRTFSLDSWATEGEPDGWDKVTTFRFSVWASAAGKTTYRLRNFRLLEKDPGENLFVNGSFEAPGIGIPYAWGSGHWGVGDLPWATDMDLWRRHWRLDTEVAHHGRTSLCIDNTADLPLLRVYSQWTTPPKSVEHCVLSAWVKSNRDGVPVELSCGGLSTTQQAGTEWSQVALTGIKPAPRLTAVIAPQAPGKLWIDAVQLQDLDKPTAQFRPAFNDEAIALREARVDWSPPTRSAEVSAGRSIQGPVQPASCTIDKHGRFLVGAKPYIQHSLGLESVKDLRILDFAAASGFRDVCCQIRESMTTEQLKAIFDRCAQVGLRIIPWLDGRIARERFEEHITTLRDHPALLCWYVYDEPSGERFAEADYRYKIARELDPDHPALINYLSNKLEGHMGDIYSTDVYPIPRSSPGSAISAVRRMKAAADKETKPVWMWLQGTGYAYFMAREPTPRELSCMVYGSLLEGARGIYYFAQIPRTKECWDEMRAMCLELDALTPALCSLESAPELTCAEPAILCRVYKHEGSVWVVAVNTRDALLDATFSVPGADGPIDVEFEDRQVQAAAGSFSDSFGPYERHVFRFPAP